MKINNKNYIYNNTRNLIDDSSDIIENDEYVGEIQNQILIKENKHKINYRNKTLDYKNKFGTIIEERNNYKLYVSGSGAGNSKQSKKYQLKKYEGNFLQSSNINNDKINKIKIKEYNDKLLYNFVNAGILRYEPKGLFYKIYQAIPIDINDNYFKKNFFKNEMDLINEENIQKNRNNFFVNSAYINKNKKISKNYVFKKPIIKKNLSDKFETNEKVPK